MPRPGMVIVAGPPGSGKSSWFAGRSFGIDFFNADDRAAQLNRGSFTAIPQTVRAQVNREFERFILDHIDRSMSFALETTLRSGVTFDQARLALSRGFDTEMYYVALGDVESNIERVILRGKRGGHSASETVLRSIHQRSLENLSIALRFPESGIELLRVFDNSALSFKGPVEIFQSSRGVRKQLTPTLPAWFLTALNKS